jgi:hypothetical protein
LVPFGFEKVLGGMPFGMVDPGLLLGVLILFDDFFFIWLVVEDRAI